MIYNIFVSLFLLFGIGFCLKSEIDTQYLDLVQNILLNGEERNDRTGTGTIAIFAPKPFVFDVSHNHFPLITTKKVNFRLIVEELLWFLSGSSNVEDLQKKNVHIWDANANKEGRAGFYSQAWRYFGATEFSHEKEKMEEQLHVDQIANVIHEIMHNPTSRRLFVSAWDPLNIANHPDVLPPCHLSHNYYVSNDDTLSMQVYQRSADMMLGIPFNLASYSLLLLLLSHVTDKKPGKITYVLGDTHIYKDHIDSALIQLDRKPYPLPKLHFNTNIKRGSGLDGLLQFTINDLELIDYESHPAIKMVMSA